MTSNYTGRDIQRATFEQLAAVTGSDYDRIKRWWNSLTVDELYALHVATSMKLRNMAKQTCS
jgi:hypothetical protein